MMLKGEKADLLVEIGESIAEQLPPPNFVTPSGSDMITFVEATFNGIAETLRRASSAKAALIRLRGCQTPETILNQHVAEHLLRLDFPVNTDDLIHIVGFTKQAYIADFPFRQYLQDYPYSVRIYEPYRNVRFSYAYQRIWFKEIPLNLRGEYFPDIPDGWVEETMFLNDNDWVYIIRTETDQVGQLPELTGDWRILFDATGLWTYGRWQAVLDNWERVIWRSGNDW